MPSRPSTTVAAFQVTDPANEVVCPLRNQDGSSCRKRCIGEKRYRSMQEHIRRAHPTHYIPKLPATEESFHLMINSNPSDHPAPPQSQSGLSTATQGLSQGLRSLPASIDNSKSYPLDSHTFSRDESSLPGTPRAQDDYVPVGGKVLGPTSGAMLPTASAAAALAQLHANTHSKMDADWESEGWHSDMEGRRIPRSAIELPPIQHVKSEITSEPFPPLNSNRSLAAILSTSPPGRSSTLPPIQRLGPGRPRNKSITKRGTHRRKNSRGAAAEWIRRLQNEDHLRSPSHERKALSAEPSADYGKRWEDLIDAAASATEDIDEDRTPVPQSPVYVQRASLPPFTHPPPHFQQHNYQASPLQQALTPPSYVQDGGTDPFPSVESGESGENFHMESHGLLPNSSPSYSSQNIQIYCAMCHNLSLLRESLACTECICGICQQCVSVLMEEQGARRKCPRCSTIGGRFKPFQVDISYLLPPSGNVLGDEDTALKSLRPRGNTVFGAAWDVGLRLTGSEAYLCRARHKNA